MDPPKPRHTHAHADTQLGYAEAYCPSCETSYPTHVETCPEDGARLVHFAAEKADDELTGSVIDGRFEIHERLGSGGMGAVYRAVQTSVGRDVAIKVIHSRLSRERATAKRFLREAKLSSRLSHANTVVAHDFGQSESGMLYLVMELLQGKTLRAVIAGTDGLHLSRVKRIGIQLSDALHAAADLGVVHRDLKPANIMILDRPAGRDRVKVLDFGLAKSLTADGPSTEITKSGALLGTPLYMAPEVIGGEEATPQSDLYALGCILYEMVCGRPPFASGSMSALFAKHLTVTPDALGLDGDPELEALIMALLSKDPADRPSDAADVHARLGGETVLRAPEAGAMAALGNTRARAAFSGAATLPATIPDTPATPTDARQAPAARRGFRIWMAALAAVLVITGGAVLWQRANRTALPAATTPAAIAPAAIMPAAGIDAGTTTSAATAATPDAAPAKPTPSTRASSIKPPARRARRNTRRRRRPARSRSATSPTTSPAATPAATPTAKKPTRKPTGPATTTPPKLDFVD